MKRIIQSLIEFLKTVILINRNRILLILSFLKECVACSMCIHMSVSCHFLFGKLILDSANNGKSQKPSNGIVRSNHKQKYFINKDLKYRSPFHPALL